MIICENLKHNGFERKALYPTDDVNRKLMCLICFELNNTEGFRANGG